MSSAAKVWELIAFIVISTIVTLSFLKMGSLVSVVILFASVGLICFLVCFTRIEYGFYGILVFGFLMASIDRIFREQYPLTSVLMVCPYLLTFIILLRGMLRRDFSSISWHPIIVFYLLQVAYIIVEIFNPEMESYLGWLSSFWQKISYVLLLLSSLYIFKSIKNIRFFFKFIAIAIFLTGLYGCIQQWYGLSSFDTRWVHSDPHILGLFSLPGSGLRKFSTMTDPANFGTLMAGGGALLLVLFLGPFSKKKRLLLLSFSIFVLLGMSYSGTRTANITLLAGLMLFILMSIYQKKTQTLVFFGGLVFVALLFAPVYGNVTLNRFRSAFKKPGNDASYNVRIVHQEFMQPYMRKHAYGGGVNTAGGPGSKYNPNHFLAGFPPDGAYFALALQEGWLGLLLNNIFFFLILFYCVRYFYKCKSEEIKTYYAAMGSMLFALFLGAYAQFTITSVPQSLIFIIFLGVIAKLHTFDQPVALNEDRNFKKN